MCRCPATTMTTSWLSTPTPRTAPGRVPPFPNRAPLSCLPLQVRLKRVDPTDSAAVYEYYMELWKVFYGCYFAMPFAR